MKLCNAQRKRRAEEVHMLKFAGAMIVILASLGVGYFLGESIRRRIRDIDALADFADFVSSEIAVYKTPLPEIFAKCDDRYLGETGFAGGLGGGVYTAAADSGMLAGDEERQIIRDFSAKIGSGGAEDMVKLCAYTASRLRTISERLKKDLPEKRKIYRAVSALAGVSVVIMLI